MVPIVILQTSRDGFRIVMSELARGGLPKESYVVVDDVHSAECEIVAGEFQLLVMGTVNGDADAAESFARRMRKKSERLIVVSFSSLNDPLSREIFHHSIFKDFSKDKICDELIQAIRGFLTLREQRKGGR